jgi:hypothetical protein
MQLQHLQKSAQLWRCWRKLWRFSSSALEVGAAPEMQLQHPQKSAQHLEMLEKTLEIFFQRPGSWRSSTDAAPTSAEVGAALEMLEKTLEIFFQRPGSWRSSTDAAPASPEVGAASGDAGENSGDFLSAPWMLAQLHRCSSNISRSRRSFWRCWSDWGEVGGVTGTQVIDAQIYS